MSTPENTSQRPAARHLMEVVITDALGSPNATSDYIEGMEAAGQRQLVASEVLPTEVLYGSDEEFEALGFVFGKAVEGDDLFREATLPEGWTRKGSGHAMWSHVTDERGIERVAIFYKAAFYDRRAHMTLVNVGRDLASKAVWGDEPLLIPWNLLTDAERDAAIEALRAEAAQDPKFYEDTAGRAQAILDAEPWRA